MTQAGSTDPLDTIPMSDVKIPLTPARAAAIRRALAALDAIPAERRELDLREYQLIASARTAGATWQQIAGRLGYKDRQAASSVTRPSPALSNHRHGHVRDGHDLRKLDENLFELKITFDTAGTFLQEKGVIGRAPVRVGGTGERAQGECSASA